VGVKAARSPEARKVLRELNRELKEAATSQGVNLVWSAASTRLQRIAIAEKATTAVLAADPPGFAGEPSDEALRRLAEHLAVSSAPRSSAADHTPDAPSRRG
jgi:hypothetical protein